MTSEQVILEKIEHLNETIKQQWKGLQKQGDDIGEIKKTVSLIAVQSNRIDNLSGQVAELWTIRKDHDDRLGEVERFQASCPKDNIDDLKKTHKDLKDETKDMVASLKKETIKAQTDFKNDMKDTMKRQWIIIAFFSAIVLGTVWKVSV